MKLALSQSNVTKTMCSFGVSAKSWTKIPFVFAKSWTKIPFNVSAKS